MTNLVIDGTHNARSVGWRPQPWLVRAANLDAMTEAGAAALAGLGIGLVVDLREDEERGIVRHGFPVRHIPIYRSREPVPILGTLEDTYESMISGHGPALAAAVAAIADSPDPVLVHCTTGADRTGLVVALALLAAGVPEDDVVDDCAQSAPDDGIAPAVRRSLRSLGRFGGAEPFLLRHGLTVDQFLALRERIAGEPDEPGD